MKISELKVRTKVETSYQVLLGSDHAMTIERKL